MNESSMTQKTVLKKKNSTKIKNVNTYKYKAIMKLYKIT